MSQKIYDLKWLGDEVVKVSEDQLKAIMGEVGLTAEGEAKKQLKKGHGVLTGTLRRSIHAAPPDYDYKKDDIEASDTSPERGGKLVEACKQGSGKFAIAVGSGMSYALAIQQGWSEGYKKMRGSFAGYHYLTIGVENARKKLSEIVHRHMVS